MVTVPYTIYAAIKPNTAPQRQKGIGKIVVEQSKVYLQAGSERIPLESLENGKVQNGDTVRYSITSTTILLTPVASDERYTQPLPSDSVTLNENTAPVKQDSVPIPFQITKTIPAGLVTFTSVEEALAYIGEENDAVLKRHLEQLLASENSITLRSVPAENGKTTVWFLSPQELTRSLQTLLQSFTSKPLSSIPVEVLQQVLADRGFLSYSLLERLDQLLQNSTSLFSDKRAGSSSAQTQAVLQWLYTAFDNESILSILSQKAPFTSATELVAELQKSSPLLSKLTGLTIPPAETFTVRTIDRSLPSNADQVIPQAFERMGFSLEQSLALQGSTQNQIDPFSTLKSLLLHLHAQLSSSQTAESSPVQSTVVPTEATNVPPSGVNSPSAIIPKENAASGNILFSNLSANIVRDYTTVTETIEHDAPLLYNWLFSSSKSLSVQYQQLPLPSQPSTAAPIDSVLPLVTKPGLLDSITTLFRDIALTATKYQKMENRHSEKSAHSEVQGQQPLSAVSAAVKTLDMFVDILTTLGTEVQSTGWINGVPPQNATITSLPSLFRTAFEAIETVIHSLLKESDAEAMLERTPGVLRERAGTDANDRLDTSTATRPEQLRQSLSRTVTEALDKIESLQLLARRISTQQGTQQIIALPIKFGETWRELNVRFLHRHRKKKKTGASRFSVYVDVAPPALGAVHARIDFQKGTQLQVTVDFERTTTREWFIKHRHEIQEALVQHGNAAVHIDFKTLFSKKTSSRSNDGSGNNMVDMKV